MNLQLQNWRQFRSTGRATPEARTKLPKNLVDYMQRPFIKSSQINLTVTQTC